MAAHNLWFFRDQLSRIVEESLEVSLVICNTELSEFTLAKIFDVFNQILPTGFVLNTGYWPFYNTLKKQSICVCSRYGIDCRHVKHDHHWLDLDDISRDNSSTFSSRYGQLCLLDSDTDVTPMTGSGAGYTLSIKLTFQYKKVERGRPRSKKDGNLNVYQEQGIHVAIFCRYNIQREYYPAIHTIMFQPSPFFHEAYGSYFPHLLQIRQSILITNLSPEMNQRYFTSAVESMPHFSLVLQHVNLPFFVFTKNMHAVYSHLEPPRLRTQNRGSQTEEQEDATEVWKYKELIGPLWSDAKAPPCQSVCNTTQMVHVDYVFNNYFPGEKPACTITEIKDELASNTIAKSIINGVDNFHVLEEVKQIKKEYEELPASTVNDKEYDVQWPKWGCQKAVTRKRGRKKNQNGALYKDVSTAPGYLRNIPEYSKFKVKREPLEAVLSSSNTGSANGDNTFLSNYNVNPTYATVVKRPKADIDFEYTAETRARVYETHKDDAGFQWFDTQFPDISSSVSLTTAQVDEGFKIAEEYIREETERENTEEGKKR